MLHDLSDSVALITGAGGGIGSAIALAMAQRGAAVAVVDLDAQAAARVAGEISAGGGRALPLCADIAREADVTRAFAGARAALGTVNCVVAAAGIAIRKAFVDTELHDWQRSIDVNLTGAFLCFREAARGMLAAAMPGTLIAISSINGSVADAFSRHAAYEASKGGLNLLVRALAVELGPQGVRVNAIAPGRIDTPLLNRDPAHVARVTTRIPLGRYGTPAEVADLAVFLSSDAARYITGQVLHIDGGWTAQ